MGPKQNDKDVKFESASLQQYFEICKKNFHQFLN